MNTPNPPGYVGTSTSKMQRLPSKACLSRGHIPPAHACTHASHTPVVLGVG